MCHALLCFGAGSPLSMLLWFAAPCLYLPQWGALAGQAEEEPLSFSGSELDLRVSLFFLDSLSYFPQLHTTSLFIITSSMSSLLDSLKMSDEPVTWWEPGAKWIGTW